MKKWIIFIFTLLIPVSIFSQNKKINFYPNVAVDLGGAIPFPLSDIPEGAGGTPKPYPSLGIGSSYQITPSWKLALEANYHLIAFSADADVVSQAFYFNDGSAQYYTGKTETDIELRFIEIPLIASYKLKENREFLFGIYYSAILEGRFESKGINGIYSPDKNITDNANLPGPEFTIEYNFNKYIDKYDVGILTGYQLNLNPKLNLWAKLNIGFKSIFIKDFNNIDYEMYQLRFNIGISYLLLN